jgi:hypothetical protein
VITNRDLIPYFDSVVLVRWTVNIGGVDLCGSWTHQCDSNRVGSRSRGVLDRHSSDR